MRTIHILCIETSASIASVAIVSDEALVASYTLNIGLTHSQTLMPMILEITSKIDFDLKKIDFIAACNGPGSFTGLRIGAATAKAFSFALKKNIIPVSTLDVLAYNVYNSCDIICPIMDARRNEVYTAFYTYEKNTFTRLSDYTAENIDVTIEKALEFNKNVIFVGDGTIPFKDKLNKEIFFIPPIHINTVSAKTLGALSLIYVNENKAVGPNEFNLEYLRKPQAERERLMKIAKI